jgi:hypothetical protein
MTDMVLQLRDLNYNIPLRVAIRGGFSPHILVGVFPEHFGDVEIAFERKDGDQIAAVLEQSADGHAGTHHFKNLDGGAEASFQVAPTDESVTVVVDRSDEGPLEFRISPDDAAKFAKALRSACSGQRNQTTPSTPNG